MNRPIIKPASNGRYELVYPFIVRMLDRFITVRAGFLFDGNSTLISRFNPHWLDAALLHDWIYRYPNYDDGTPISRLEADQIYYIFLKHLGVWGWVRKLFFAGVRLFGWVAWRRHRSQKCNTNFVSNFRA